jgi:hypothetical protein
MNGYNYNYVVVPIAASLTIGSHERGMKHTEATGKTRSGSGKPLATDGVGTGA